MRKKILAAVLAATMPEIMNGSKKVNEKKETSSVEKIEVETAPEAAIVEETSVVEEIVPEEVAVEETVVEDVSVEETIVDEIIIEEKSPYIYEFEGKYWLRYSEYGHKGLYFDGTQAISKMENSGTFCREYSVEGDVIYIGEPFYRYEIREGKLGLAFVRDEMGGFSYYEEVEKAEYDSIFR